MSERTKDSVSTPSLATILEARGLCYTYPDGTTALQDIHIKLQSGQTTALLGGNGAGKSTLLLACNALLRPTAGCLWFDQRPITYSAAGMRELRREVGIVFQEPDHQLFSANVIEDISFGPLNLGLPIPEVRSRVAEALELTGITHLRDRPTHALSYGQKKRVALAGVLAMRPRLLLLDEPTAGLDPEGTAAIMRLLHKIRDDLGLTLMIATHDIDLVPLYCDHVIVMDGGRIALQGSCAEVFAQSGLMRRMKLRLPRISHLMEILQKRDNFIFTEQPLTIAAARRALRGWRRRRVDAPTAQPALQQEKHEAPPSPGTP